MKTIRSRYAMNKTCEICEMKPADRKTKLFARTYTVYHCGYCDPRVRPVSDTAMRPCLRCDEKFHSISKFNRTCDSCKTLNPTDYLVYQNEFVMGETI